MQSCEAAGAWLCGLPLSCQRSAVTPGFRALANSYVTGYFAVAPGPVLGDAGDPDVSQMWFLPPRSPQFDGKDRRGR